MSAKDEAEGTVDNVKGTASQMELVDVLPPSIAGTLIWARDTIPRGLGFADRTKNITGVIGLTFVMIIASATMLTYVAVAYAAIALPIALLRFIPAVDRRWPIDKESWPFWKVQDTGFGM